MARSSQPYSPELKRAPTTDEVRAVQKFIEHHRDVLRYVGEAATWRYWDGDVWKDDRYFTPEQSCYEMLQRLYHEIEDQPLGPVKMLRLRNAVIRLARTDRRMMLPADEWDSPASNWLLNTRSGVVNLKTGELLKHDPRQYITKLAGISPKDMKTPIWDNFLNWATEGDRKLQAYLKRVFGYALTGDTSEQSFFFAYGTGGNGKSILMNTVAEIIGSYHAKASMRQFVGEDTLHSTYTAALVGARLVTASETEKGRRWNEPAIKSMTSGEAMRANFMRKDTFVFTPHFKIFVAGNDRPLIGKADEAICRRMHVIGFRATIDRDKRDPYLFDKIKPEWPGILYQLIEGCLEWQSIGLAPPPSVLEETAEYFRQADPIVDWFHSCCVREAENWLPIEYLYKSWEFWSKANEQRTGSKNQFSANLEQRAPALGIRKARRRDGSGFKGIQFVKGLSVLGNEPA